MAPLPAAQTEHLWTEEPSGYNPWGPEQIYLQQVNNNNIDEKQKYNNTCLSETDSSVLEMVHIQENIGCCIMYVVECLNK